MREALIQTIQYHIKNDGVCSTERIIFDVKQILERMSKEGIIYQPKKDCWKVVQ